MSNVSSGSIATGHQISQEGHAAVFILLEEGANKCSMSPLGARIIARQILEWADHADRWKKMPDEDRKVEWIARSKPPESAMQWQVAIRAASIPEPVVNAEIQPGTIPTGPTG